MVGFCPDHTRMKNGRHSSSLLSNEKKKHELAYIRPGKVDIGQTYIGVRKVGIRFKLDFKRLA